MSAEILTLSECKSIEPFRKEGGGVFYAKNPVNIW